MVQGRGSAMVVSVLLGLLMLQFEVTQAATFVVGGSTGWSFYVNSWTKGKIFKAGDILVFNYSPSLHNVVTVSKTGYNSCKTSKGSKVYRSGKDRIKLVKGPNYFICSFPGHCQSGMKIAVNAK